jgi:hypothetical protein
MSTNSSHAGNLVRHREGEGSLSTPLPAGPLMRGLVRPLVSARLPWGRNNALRSRDTSTIVSAKVIKDSPEREINQGH